MRADVLHGILWPLADIVDIEERDREGFYQDYTAACDELGAAPLSFLEFLALVETLAGWPSATLH